MQKRNNIYLDHNATSPLLPEVAKIMSELAQQAFANPSSPHWAGRDARILLENSREILANALGAKPREIFFTSGGSESNNTVLRQLLMTSQDQHLICSSVEHPSVSETCKILAEQENIIFSEIDVNSSGIIDPENFLSKIRPETVLISIISANNETGNIQPIEELIKISRDKKIPFHTDLVQSFCKMDFDLSKYVADYATVTAHKIGGPRGIGVLYVKEGTPFHPLITGGKQERTRRAGTENVILAVGFSKAVESYLSKKTDLRKKFFKFREKIIDEINKHDGIFINTDLENSLPNTINFGFHGISAESLLISLDLDGVAISTGSACSSGAMEASPILLAMGLSHDDAKSSMRISSGWTTTEEEIDYLCERLEYHILRMKKKN